ncbi:MAG: hypothetical protein IJM50_05080 [Lachnospiraceae bacterium]|nr:hypothetical protein [Lachnospiraceae bacterium]
MWRKVYKVCFYILFVLMLLAVITASVICFVYASTFKLSEYYLYGVLTLIGGVIFAFVTFAFNGMILEAADNIAAVREAVAPKKSRRAVQNVRPVQQPVSPVQTVQPLQAVPQPAAVVHETAGEVRETVVETRQAASENENVLRESPLYAGEKSEE